VDRPARAIVSVVFFPTEEEQLRVCEKHLAKTGKKSFAGMGDEVFVRVGCEEPSAGGSPQGWLDACHPVSPYAAKSEQMEAFGLQEAVAKPIQFGDYKLDVAAGASVNCHEVTFCAHGSGTHTECMGHITEQRVEIGSCAIPVLASAVLVSVSPGRARAMDLEDAMAVGDRIITREVLKKAVKGQLKQFSGERQLDALCVRVMGTYSRDFHRARKFTNTNPPYFTRDAMYYMLELGVRHLLVDLPSIDREESGPLMPNHSIFFGLEPGCKDAALAIRPKATVTESCNFYNDIGDGEYILSLQVSPIEMDAAPSRPKLLPLTSATCQVSNKVKLAIGASIAILGFASLAYVCWTLCSSSSPSNQQAEKRTVRGSQTSSSSLTSSTSGANSNGPSSSGYARYSAKH